MSGDKRSRSRETALLTAALRLSEAGNEAGVAHELCGDVMVGMTAVARGRDDDARLEAADHRGDRRSRLGGVRDARIRQFQIFANGNAEDFRGFGGLGRADRGGSAGAHLTLAEIENAGATALTGELGEGAAGVQLGVVAVGEDGEDIDGGHSERYGAL